MLKQRHHCLINLSNLENVEVNNELDLSLIDISKDDGKKGSLMEINTNRNDKG